MDLLKIDGNHDAYFNKNGDWAAIRDIERDDLLALIRSVAASDSIELDECTADNEIRNPIERTIYQQVYKLLYDLDEHRDLYLAEIDAEFDELERRYRLR